MLAGAFAVCPSPGQGDITMSNNRANGTPASGSWRSTFPIHPAAELFPRMSPDELRALGKDIINNGLMSPIALWQPDPRSPLSLLDGINRLDAIEITTGKPVIIAAPSLKAGDFLACNKVIVLGRAVDPYEYVISANIHRRHLTGAQKRDLIAKLIRATPEKSNNAIAKQLKVDDKTVAKVRGQLERSSEIPKIETRIDTKGRKRPAKRKPTRGRMHPEAKLGRAILALIRAVEESTAARSKGNGSPAETAPSCGLIWNGDDENGWFTKIENRYYGVTRSMSRRTGRAKNKKNDHFIYTACCFDIRGLEKNPKLITRYGERIEPPNLPDPHLARTADEAKALCEEAERRNPLPAPIEAKPATDAAPPTADDGLDIPEYLRRTAP